MINVGLLGCGRIGQVHGRSLAALPSCRAAAVADAVPAAAEALAAEIGAQVSDVDAILADPGIDAVVIGTPTDTHQELVIRAAEAGKAVLCEKPLDLSVDRIREALAVVERCGVPLMTGFNRRFDPDFSRLHQALRDGEAGDVETVVITSRDPAPPPVDYVRRSGGIFRDMMIHDLDMARFLLGEEPVEVFATGACLVDPAIGEAGDMDTAAAVLRTRSGRICQISCSRRAAYGYDQRIEVHGSRGMLRVSNALRNRVEKADRTGFGRAPAEPFFLERYAAAYRLEMEAFVRAIEAGAAPSPDGTDGLLSQILADAADASARSGELQTLT